MRDFYEVPGRAPQDQADGLRRLFAGRRRHVLPLAANPHVPFGSFVLDRLAAVLASQGHEVLVVDAADTSPRPNELSDVDLSACIEPIAPRVAYLAARGLPLAHVDTRGSSGGFIDAAWMASPPSTVMLLHADGVDLARLLKHRDSRPLLIGADHPESVKHAYANAKLLVRRCALMTFDLLLAAAPQSPRAAGIQLSIAGCLENFLGALIRHGALVDPAGDLAEAPDEALAHLLAAQLALQDGPSSPQMQPGPRGGAADARAFVAERTAATPVDRPAFR